ncbi:GNAT family N-acetyltransferase [Ekhidna sp. To15]|uniref:GNAT family N-acetyltransferase n=1 Tax=Ekhidna sp. To15 TaxID=3395267 RepID=UPI003F520B97
MNETAIHISSANEKNYSEVGKLMVEVYSNLEGFPSPDEQPGYYEMLANMGVFAEKPTVDILIAKRNSQILGAVVYIGDVGDYGAGIDLSREKAAGFRLLAVSPVARGLGIGKLLTHACLDRARSEGLPQMIIHTTDAMKVAWGMYENMGFKRSKDLDFLQKGFPVYGFRLEL